MRGENHAERRAPVPVGLHPVEGTRQGMIDESEEVGLQAHQDRLRLGIAQPAVELQRLRRSGRIDHQAGVKEADIRRAVLRHALDRRRDDLAHHARVELRRDDRRRRVGTHAASVRPLVAVAQAFVVLAGGERQHVHAVAHDDEARFLALQEFLDHHALARGAELLLPEHRVDRRVRLLARRGDDHALAGGEAIGLDDDRRALFVDVRLRLTGGGESRVAGRRDAVAEHERLGEILRRLELRGGLPRPEDAQARLDERVDHAIGERRLGPDHGEVDALLLREGEQIGDRRDGDIVEAVLRRGAAVTRRDEYLLHARALRQLPGHRVLAAAAADDEEFHFSGGSGARR